MAPPVILPMWPRWSRKFWNFSRGFGRRSSGGAGRKDGGGGGSVGMARDRREALDEAFELRHATIEAIRLGDIVGVVDAAVLLQHPDVELLQHPVEFGDNDGVHCLASVHGHEPLLEDFALRELQEEVL